MYQILKNKTMLILSYWGYPVGGGEEYLYQTAIWAVKHKMRAYWICFANSKNEFFVDFLVSEIDGFKLIKIPGGFNQKILLNWVKLFWGNPKSDIWLTANKPKIVVMAHIRAPGMERIANLKKVEMGEE